MITEISRAVAIVLIVIAVLVASGLSLRAVAQEAPDNNDTALDDNIEQIVGDIPELDVDDLFPEQGGSVDPFKASEGALDFYRELGVNIPDKAQRSEQIAEAKDNLPSLLVFVSYSMPESVLQAWHRQATRAGGALVMQGLVADDFQQTFAKSTEVFGTLGGYLIDPTLFRMFAIEQVPAVVVLQRPIEACFTPGCALVPPPHDKIGGNITLQYALETFAEEGETQAQSAALVRQLSSVTSENENDHVTTP